MLQRLDEREPGATFALGDICWIDFETRGPVGIAAGSDRYARAAQAIILAWAIGGGPINHVAVADFRRPLDWRQMPRELVDFYVNRVAKGTAVVCAHSAGFDRAIWNHATLNFPPLPPHWMIDTRVQATASGLPAALDTAARFCGASHQKDPAGKALIKLFCLPESTATPQSHPDEWQAFISYAKSDVPPMRDLFQRTRQLPLAEWCEYWAAEAINDRGVMIDRDLADKAAAMAAIDQRRAGRDLAALTSGAVTAVNQVKRITEWLTALLPSEGRDILVKRYEEVDEEGNVTKPRKWALTRDRVIRLLAWLDSEKPLSGPLYGAERALQIRLYGGSKTPAKFSKMMSQQVDGIIRGQYQFNGASQTGRFSARGVQIHNLTRDPLDNEIDAIDALTGGIDYDQFATLGDDTPVSRKLSLLIRPTLVAQTGNAFCWADWSNIEARITPWLADDPEADARLEIFRAVDRGEEKYDIYTRTAASLSGLSLDEAKDPAIRQRGKVVELAASFGGGVGALLAMAASYRMHLTDGEARIAVDRWREENPWAKRFWGRHDKHGVYGLWGAANSAILSPGTAFTAGRITYVFLRDYLGGSLLCRLPSGRFLTYRRIRWEMVTETDEDTGEIIDIRRELMFSRDMGRVKLWPGLLCENVTQAAAADLLRGTLRRLQEYPKLTSWMPTVLHTHDEIVVETSEKRVAEATALLAQFMVAGFDWTDGLPIAADTTIARWYSKNKLSYGL